MFLYWRIPHGHLRSLTQPWQLAPLKPDLMTTYGRRPAWWLRQSRDNPPDVPGNYIWRAVGGCEGWFCETCERWADYNHVTSDRHLKWVPYDVVTPAVAPSPASSSAAAACAPTNTAGNSALEPPPPPPPLPPGLSFPEPPPPPPLVQSGATPANRLAPGGSQPARAPATVQTQGPEPAQTAGPTSNGLAPATQQPDPLAHVAPQTQSAHSGGPIYGGGPIYASWVNQCQCAQLEQRIAALEAMVGQLMAAVSALPPSALQPAED
jgi:hypothetical protein